MKEKNNIPLDELVSLMEEDRKNLVITSRKNLKLIAEDTTVERIIRNQKKLHDMAYEMYELSTIEPSAIPLLIENLTILEINRNLTEVFILLKNAKEETRDLIKAIVASEFNLKPESSMSDIYTYLIESSKKDTEKSEKNYQKVLKMKGDKHE